MIKVGPIALEAPVRTRLEMLQQEIDDLPSYSQRVAAGKTRWGTKPKATFEKVREALATSCSGNRRCHYCEDSLADEVEHMRPKDLYPDLVFVSSNYLFACGPCNGPKNNAFAVVTDEGGARRLVDVSRQRNDPIVPPKPGVPALIDPRLEDPVEMLWLDFGTGLYTPNVDDPAAERALRIDYTIQLLRLNDRDDLVRGRRAAYSGFLSRLDRYASRSWGTSERDRFIDELRTERYRGVWVRMKRYREFFPELQAQFERLPEALAW